MPLEAVGATQEEEAEADTVTALLWSLVCVYLARSFREEQQELFASVQSSVHPCALHLQLISLPVPAVPCPSSQHPELLVRVGSCGAWCRQRGAVL